MNSEGKKILMLATVGFVLGALLEFFMVMLFASTDDGLVFIDPNLSEKYGDALTVILQIAVPGTMGAVNMATTRIYDSERFNILGATLTHMVIVLTATLSTGWFMGWFGPSLTGTVMFTLAMLVGYFFIWFMIYINTKKKTDLINELLEKRRDGKE